MAYETLKSDIQGYVRQNGEGAITGDGLQSILLEIVNTLGTGYKYVGVATPSTSPGTPTETVFYIGGAGTYANFGTTVNVAQGQIAVFKYNNGWSADTLITVVGEGGVSTSMIAASAVTNAKINDGAVGTSKLGANAVTTAKIADNAVETAKIKDGNVTTAKLASKAVTTAKIDDGAVTPTQIADNAVETAKIKDSNVTTSKIADSNVTTAKVADKAITKDKIADSVNSDIDWAVAANSLFQCTTEGATAAKEVTATGYDLRGGGSIKIKFTNKNTATSPTLSINGSLPKQMMLGNKSVNASNTWEDGQIVEFIYYPLGNVFYGCLVGQAKPAYININELANHPAAYADASTALAAVPTMFRCKGTKVVYYDDVSQFWIEMTCQDDSGGADWWTNVDLNWVIEGPFETDVMSATGGQMIRIAGEKKGDLDDFLNVNVWAAQIYAFDSKNAARQAVPAKKRKIGLTITYLLDDMWYTEQFKDADKANNWLVDSAWQCLGPVSVSQNTLTIGGEEKGELYESIDNPEFVEVHADNNGNITFGARKDGTFYFGAGCPPQVVEYITKYGYDKETIDALLDGTANGKSLINKDFADNIDYDSENDVIKTSKPLEVDGGVTIGKTNNPEFVDVHLDDSNKILYGIKKSGKMSVPAGIEEVDSQMAQMKSDIDAEVDEKIAQIQIENFPLMMVQKTATNMTVYKHLNSNYYIGNSGKGF